MLTLENDSPARFVTVVSSDYPEFEGSRALAQMVDDRLCLVADCLDGVQRTYRSTRVSAVFDMHSDLERLFSGEPADQLLLFTRSGREWVLA